MLVKIAVLLASAVYLVIGGSAFACDEFLNIPDTDIKENRDMLKNVEADPLDRLFAFKKLICSDNPVIRSYAIREGIGTVSDPLVREQIMLDALFQKTRIDVELTLGNSANDLDKAFAKERANLLSFEIGARAPKDGCLSLYSSKECRTSASLRVYGSRVEMNYDSVIGEFHLSETNELVGFVRPGSGYSRIPAVIKLF